MSAPVHWRQIHPSKAADLPLMVILADVVRPLGEDGIPCPFPWDPQLLNAPLGQYHCPYCGSMVMAGMPHVDYAKEFDDA